jgi:endo-1,4-beta-D-glucanase Y
MSGNATAYERSLDATPAPPPRQPGRRRRTGVLRRVLLATLVMLLVVGGISALSIEGSRRDDSASRGAATPLRATSQAAARTDARADALAFLQRYESSDGRVVRRDQGGDTVSEGQGYAMLLAVAIGARQQFADAWRWDQTHLQLPNALFAYHWSDGKVVSAQPATDADLDTAWALVLASQRFHDSLYLAHGLQVANAILANETAVVAGTLQLVAGPWGRTSPAVADPSYFSVEAMDALEAVTGDPRWSELAADSTALVTSLTGTGRTLPTNWADIEPTGAAQAIGDPSNSDSPPAYGLDAQRVPVWFAAGCTQSERAVAADAWPLLRHSPGEGARISYSVGGAARSNDVNPLGSVAAAAAASAAGDQGAAATLLAAADRQSARFPTYYGGAWVALGRVLLDTPWLSPCAPALGSA